jgi:phosphoglycolate phosphatase
MEKKFVLFDFDGVIADTFHIGHSVAQKICSYITESEYRKYHEENIIEKIRIVRAQDHGDRCDHALDWLGEYLPAFNEHAKSFEGMPEVLRKFAQIYTLCVVSSSQEDPIEHFLEKYGLNDTIQGIYGLYAGTRKDEKFKTIFAKYAIEPREAVFITDTLGDINEAANVGLKSIGVTWGFQDHATLARGNPFRIVDKPEELSKAVTDYFASEA